jgi:hypothetical protein
VFYPLSKGKAFPSADNFENVIVTSEKPLAEPLLRFLPIFREG